MNAGALPVPAALQWRVRPGAAQSVGLWVFMAVATTLFSLFGVAYVMRLSASDAVAIGLPWQLWLSTASLVAGSLLLQQAARRAQRGHASRAPLLAGGACALLFVACQAWAWAALLGARVSFTGNPAGSFFYVLTALHGLHVLGGLLAWAWVLRAPDAAAWRIALCARYWHFLLAVWVVLFTALGTLDPEVAARICGSR
ncbi:bb3-type cytochrome oxidase subunit III [Roseateles sp.]|uniref:bb3-type cytochrome oxidase subunit III n=1 Tax=Roseateles sp. TaxID=1971397 RepID=UPI0025E534FC|nr:bb3-type cytochrome oxidase subunit III [Roseateles sp.]MBV8034643.1 bb3-type cytochrome oxidase subunit III [Roseateles sp.]